MKTLEHRLSLLEATLPAQQDGPDSTYSSITSPPTTASRDLQGPWHDIYGASMSILTTDTTSPDPTDGMGHFIFANEEDVGYFGQHYLLSDSGMELTSHRSDVEHTLHS